MIREHQNAILPLSEEKIQFILMRVCGCVLFAPPILLLLCCLWMPHLPTDAAHLRLLVFFYLSTLIATLSWHAIHLFFGCGRLDRTFSEELYNMTPLARFLCLFYHIMLSGLVFLSLCQTRWGL